MAKPTVTQAETIRYFAGLPRRAPRVHKPTELTYAACVRNGWIEKTEEWPYHKTTPEGLAAIEVKR